MALPPKDVLAAARRPALGRSPMALATIVNGAAVLTLSMQAAFPFKQWISDPNVTVEVLGKMLDELRDELHRRGSDA